MAEFTKEQLQKIIAAADDVLTALAGTNDDIHHESDAMLRAWDDLNDRYAPPKVVAAMARQLLAGLEQEPVGITDRSEIEGLKRGEMANVMPPDFKGVDAGDEVLLYETPQLPQPGQDYFSSLVSSARDRADKAMRKFPQPNYVLNKVAEENGEVIKAVIHYTEGREEWANVEGEIVDNLAMLIRLVTEGDQVIGFTPPESCRAAMIHGDK